MPDIDPVKRPRPDRRPKRKTTAPRPNATNDPNSRKEIGQVEFGADNLAFPNVADLDATNKQALPTEAKSKRQPTRRNSRPERYKDREERSEEYREQEEARAKEKKETPKDDELFQDPNSLRPSVSDLDPNSRMDIDEGIRPLSSSEVKRASMKEKKQKIEKRNTQTDNRAFKEPPKSAKRQTIKNDHVAPIGNNPYRNKKISAKEQAKVDKRKNKLLVTKIVRGILAFVIVTIFLMGLKNTFFPPPGLTEEEVIEISKFANGNTGFPLERGAAFVEDFITRYLTIVPGNRLAEEQLKFFYTGQYSESSTTSDTATPNWASGVNQRVVYPPKVYKMDTIRPYLGRYYVSAYISDSDGSVGAGADPNQWREVAHWMYFKVDVFYDEDKETISIIPGTLSLIPPYEIANAYSIPNADPLGTPDENLTVSLTPTIHGFIQAFAKASPKNYESLVQYIPKDPDRHLIQGFNNTVVLDGDPNTAIKKIAYRTKDPNEFKVLVSIAFRDNKASSYVGYTSNYVMTIEAQGDGYIVNRFLPYTYTSDIALGY